jgi:GNAT superfamily N-acetyltransferase
VASRDGSPLGRVVAYAPASAGGFGALGQFESVDDTEAASALLREAVEWLRSLGVQELLGPMDGDTWHRYRWNCGPYGEPPFLMEPTNPAYYPRLWEGAGFRPVETYHSKRVDRVAAAAEKFAPIYDRFLRRGYKLQAFDPRRFDSELTRLYELSLAIFEANKFYTPIGFPEFRRLYEPAKSLIDPRLVRFAQSPEGHDVGFVFAVHDYHAAVEAMRGGSGPLAKLRFWMNKRHAKAVNVKSLGVTPSHRGAGVAAAMMCAVYRQIEEMGFRRANLCLIHDDNASTRLDAGLGETMRRYCLYHYAEPT